MLRARCTCSSRATPRGALYLHALLRAHARAVGTPRQCGDLCRLKGKIALDIYHQLPYDYRMRTEQVGGRIYFIEQYAGRLSGTKVQEILTEEYGRDFPEEDWEIRITTTTIGTDRISSALVERRRN